MAERIDRIGQRFGDYVLHSRLGGGSFGDVYLGEQVHEHSLAAIKVLHVRLTRSEDLRAFINEVRTFRLQHPHIVRMLDVGLTQDETPFLVMTYAPGGTLRDRHPKGSRLSPAQVSASDPSRCQAGEYAAGSEGRIMALGLWHCHGSPQYALPQHRSHGGHRALHGSGANPGYVPPPERSVRAGDRGLRVVDGHLAVSGHSIRDRHAASDDPSSCLAHIQVGAGT